MKSNSKITTQKTRDQIIESQHRKHDSFKLRTYAEKKGINFALKKESIDTRN